MDSSQCVPLRCEESIIKIGGKIELEGDEQKNTAVGASAAFRFSFSFHLPGVPGIMTLIDKNIEPLIFWLLWLCQNN
jgi:hypothetical protein